MDKNVKIATRQSFGEELLELGKKNKDINYCYVYINNFNYS